MVQRKAPLKSLILSNDMRPISISMTLICSYHPIPVVLSRGSGAKVWDTEGVEYLDFLSAYSSVNQGHCHPRLVAAAQNQLSKLTLTSRAFFNDKLGPYAKFITEVSYVIGKCSFLATIWCFQ